MTHAPPLSARPKLPFPSWPIWTTFAVFLIPCIIGLWLLGGVKDSMADAVVLQSAAEGNSVVVDGTLSDVETTSGLPKASSIYEVTLPAEAGPALAGETLLFSGDEKWGFPPSNDFPSDLSFLVVLDDQPRAVSHGPVGSIDPVTEQTVAGAESALTTATAVWVSAIVVFWIFTLGLPTLGTVLFIRRRRAKQLWRSNHGAAR